MSEPTGAVHTVGVAGSGAMGRGIAESCLRAGASVLLQDTSPDALRAARGHIEAALQRSVDKGHLAAGDAASCRERLREVDDVVAFAPCDLVVEAVPEVLELKLGVLRRIESGVGASAVVCTNTSSIPVTKLADLLADPSRFAGLHFFNPVPKMQLVEIVPTVLTGEATVAALEHFVRDRLGKFPLTVPDRPGFAVNALLIPYLLSAARMLDSGYASAEDIDNGMKLGCGHPIGPLELSDFIGLDVVVHVADSIWAETRDPASVVPNNLRRLVEAGRTGRKAGHGFYDHN